MAEAFRSVWYICTSSTAANDADVFERLITVVLAFSSGSGIERVADGSLDPPNPEPCWTEAPSLPARKSLLDLLRRL